MARAQKYLNDAALEVSSPDFNLDLSCIGVEANVSSSDQSTADGIRLRLSLPLGYPSEEAAEVTVLSTPKDFPKSTLDELSSRLSSKTIEMIGNEVMMELINECRDVLDDWKASSDIIVKDEVEETAIPHEALLGRRWIWVHHITNSSRLKDIAREAQQLNLGGYLKGGYPGVVVVEGPTQSCDEFVSWIKGNKSMPGGFGRNWGHHVRGEATIDVRQLPGAFEELEDDMGRLGALCREHGVEKEFREFILQHK